MEQQSRAAQRWPPVPRDELGVATHRLRETGLDIGARGFLFVIAILRASADAKLLISLAASHRRVPESQSSARFLVNDTSSVAQEVRK